ncbi:MAG: SNF2 helicase-associated domain-containing protein, partial [Nitriliruptor sp.]|uniref:SNF2 helicase-associated domain-containing protein n=1 Tax=Nitriliruptor sp. TaxID=2448056 RepID=UPI00349FEB82
MTVLHAVWSDDLLHVWGERSLTTGRLPRPRGRAPADGRPRRHPYAVRHDELRIALGELTGLTLASSLPATETQVLLPTGVAAPLPSPDLPGANDATETARGLRAWRSDAVEVAGTDALELLLSLPAEPPPGARPAASLRAASTIATLALELASRGRVVPGLDARAGRFEARWLPVLDRVERHRLAALVPALPPALLAAADEDQRAPGTVLRELVEQLVDAACRNALAGQRLTSARGRRRVETAWLLALTASDPAVVHPDVGELQLLAKELAAWHRSGQRATPLRAAFRLSPPPVVVPDPTDLASDGDPGLAGEVAEEAQPWRLEFTLQAMDDPSLIVPAAEIWTSEETLRFLDRTFEAPEERLLGDLGRAARLYPEIGRALTVARPEALDLDLDEVLAFLGDTASLLEQAGFGVLLPDELRRPARLGARLQTSARRSRSEPGEDSGLLGYEGIVDYRWQVAIGDQSLTVEELTELARLKAPLVRLRGRWVELREDDLAAALRLLTDGGSGEMTVAEAARIGLGVADAGTELEFAGIDADGPLGVLLDGDADRQIEALTTPAGLDGQLRPYQERGLAWLAFLDA